MRKGKRRRKWVTLAGKYGDGAEKLKVYRAPKASLV
jgi:hypothetical protein